ncbi:MAG: glycosyltransferase family 9 protein [Pseudomonadota bacterium]
MTTSPSRVLVIKLGALGDVIQALGPFAAIRNQHPAAEITLLTTAPFAEFLGNCPYFDRVWIDPRAPWWRLDAILALRRRLVAGQFEGSTTCRPRRAARAIFACCRSRVRNGRGSRPAARIPTPTRGATRCTRSSARPASCAPPASRTCRRPIYPGSSPTPRASRCRHPMGCWPRRRRASARQTLAGRAVRRVGAGARGPRHHPGADRHCGRAGADRRDRGRRRPGTRDLTGQTGLADLVALGRGAALAVGNDTGPMHLLAVAGAPSLVLFSHASDPALCAPRGRRVEILRVPLLSALPVDAVLARLPA